MFMGNKKAVSFSLHGFRLIQIALRLSFRRPNFSRFTVKVKEIKAKVSKIRSLHFIRRSYPAAITISSLFSIVKRYFADFFDRLSKFAKIL